MSYVDWHLTHHVYCIPSAVPLNLFRSQFCRNHIVRIGGILLNKQGLWFGHTSCTHVYLPICPDVEGHALNASTEANKAVGM